MVVMIIFLDIFHWSRDFYRTKHQKFSACGDENQVISHRK